MRTLIKVPDAARHLGISQTMVRRLLREKRLAGEKIRGRWMVAYPCFRNRGSRGPRGCGPMPFRVAANSGGGP